MLLYDKQANTDKFLKHSYIVRNEKSHSKPAPNLIKHIMHRPGCLQSDNTGQAGQTQRKIKEDLHEVWRHFATSAPNFLQSAVHFLQFLTSRRD